MLPFSEWESFYVIVGSSAAALAGLQFIVIALLADLRSRRTTREIDAFATPTILPFIGIRKAWDTVTYLVVGEGTQPDSAREQPPGHGTLPPA